MNKFLFWWETWSEAMNRRREEKVQLEQELNEKALLDLKHKDDISYQISTNPTVESMWAKIDNIQAWVSTIQLWLIVIVCLLMFTIGSKHNRRDEKISKRRSWESKHLAVRGLTFVWCIVIPTVILLWFTYLAWAEPSRFNPYLTAPLFYGIVKTVHDNKYSHWITGWLLILVIFSFIVRYMIINHQPSWMTLWPHDLWMSILLWPTVWVVLLLFVWYKKMIKDSDKW